MQVQKTRRVPLIAIALITVCVMSCVALGGIGLSVLYLNQIFGPETNDFDRETWLAWHNKDDLENPRINMANYVEEWLLIEHPTEAEVLEYLGPPDDRREENMIVYNLGFGFIDYYWLHVYFGDDNRVNKVYRIQS